MAEFTLHTARLVLRPIAPDDVTYLYALWTDPEVRRYLWDDKIIEEDIVRAVIEASGDSFERHGFGQWLLVHRETGAPIGFCGLRYVDNGPEVELLYGLHPDDWGEGYATEACRAVLNHAFAAAGLERVIADIDPPNTASEKVLHRLGMTFEKQFIRNGLHTRRYAMKKDRFSHHGTIIQE